MPAGVAVFGSSEPLPGQPLYTQAYDVGRALAGSGLIVVTGGYGGVMEAASRGAQEAGGETLGVTCSIFGERSPNRWLTREIVTEDLLLRTRELIHASSAFVVLAGKAGTLAEVSLLWALDRAACLAERPVVLLGDVWPALLDHLESTGWLEPARRTALQLAREASAAAALVSAALKAP